MRDPRLFARERNLEAAKYAARAARTRYRKVEIKQEISQITRHPTGTYEIWADKATVR